MTTIIQSKKSILIPLVGLLVLALILGFYPLFTAQGATVTSRSDTLSDSRPSTVSNHTIEFTTPGGVALTDTITVTFPVGFDTSTIIEDDVDLADDTVDHTTAPDCTGTEQASAAMAADVLTITICAGDGGAIAGGSVVEIEIGTNATASGTGVNQITNDVAGVANVVIGGTFPDDGTIRISIIAGVTVTATVAETLTHSIALVTNPNCDTSFTTLGGPDSTVTTVPFGTIGSDTFFHSCQDVRVATNASAGHNTTVHETTSLLVGADTIDDTICDGGTCTESVSDVWATATVNGFGYSCANEVGTPCVIAATTDYRQFACVGTDAQCDPGTGAETAQNVMTAGAAIDHTARVEYKISIGALQPAGDYTNTIVYVSTPTY